MAEAFGHWLVDDLLRGQLSALLIESPEMQSLLVGARGELLGCMYALRPDLVSLVDAWDFSDFQLRSTLGGYDGNYEERLVEEVRRNPINSDPLRPLKRVYEDPEEEKAKSLLYLMRYGPQRVEVKDVARRGFRSRL